MANRRRGEIEAVLDGRPHTLCLTLGALAELEQAFGAGDILGLAERFEQGRMAAGDAIKIIAAGLKGGGHNLSAEDVADMRVDGGAAGFVRIIAELLQVTFGGEEAAPPSVSAREGDAISRSPRQAREGASSPPAPPFLGTK